LSALFDTSVVLDYLRGVTPADAAFERFQRRAITVTTWVEVMSAAPERLGEPTRDFLQTFERLAINEAIADRAFALLQQHSRLRLRHAMPWATAQLNSLVYVTADFPSLGVRDETTLFIPYRNTRGAKGGASTPR
jgi:predicted nucleic acid-binding protein